MPTPFLADGTLVQIDDGASNAFADITGVITITPPVAEVGVYDTTHLKTTAGIMTKAPLSRAEPGEMSWTMQYDMTEYARLVALRGVAKNLKITYPTTPSKTDTIPLSIKKVDPGELENQKMGILTVTAAVLGAVVRA
jgi:hypothetical protein